MLWRLRTELSFEFLSGPIEAVRLLGLLFTARLGPTFVASRCHKSDHGRYFWAKFCTNFIQMAICRRSNFITSTPRYKFSRPFQVHATSGVRVGKLHKFKCDVSLFERLRRPPLGLSASVQTMRWPSLIEYSVRADLLRVTGCRLFPVWSIYLTSKSLQGASYFVHHSNPQLWDP